MWVDEEKSCIDLYALQDYHFKKGEIGFISFSNFSVEPGPGVILTPFSKQRLIGLYYPNTFNINSKKKISLPVDVRGQESLVIEKGSYIASYKLITTRYYHLQLKRLDKGLRSAFIKIEYEESNNLQSV
jgi:hypothetical protein